MKANNWMVIIMLIVTITGCKQAPIDCVNLAMSIENRWYMENGGLSINDEIRDEDKKFICEHVNAFGKGEEVGVNYGYGDIDVYINNRKIQAIFTYKNGVVYRVGVGKYVYDEELTVRLMQLMYIKKRCWGSDC